MKQLTIDQIKGKLANGKEISSVKESQVNDILCTTYIRFHRVDIIPNSKYTTETYILTIERCDSKYVPGNCPMLIDLHLEFKSVETLVEYLVANKYVKKEEILKERP